MPATFAFSHATSFCGAVWDPIVEELEGKHLVWDQIGHGHATALARPVDWWEFGADVAKKVSQVDGSLVGVGHSMGGTALVMAELLVPGTFDFLVLIEPIVSPGPFEPGDSPLARSAEKRRAAFPSLAEARHHLRRKAPFATWNDKAFDGYLRDGFRSTGNGSEVRLSCEPRVEAEIYRTASSHGVWDRFSEIEVPVLVMAGGVSDTHDQALVREMASRFPSAGFEIVPGVGHFLPMERPEYVADRLRRLGRWLTPESASS